MLVACAYMNSVCLQQFTESCWKQWKAESWLTVCFSSCVFFLGCNYSCCKWGCSLGLWSKIKGFCHLLCWFWTGKRQAADIFKSVEKLSSVTSYYPPPSPFAGLPDCLIFFFKDSSHAWLKKKIKFTVFCFCFGSWMHYTIILKSNDKKTIQS